MYLLALETTDKAASVAIFNDSQLLQFEQLPLQIRSAQSLAPGIQRILQQAAISPQQIELVAVAEGPGSFTGLRVGVVTAKTFAWAVNAKIIGVDTLEAIANNAPPEVKSVSVAMDCQRGQVIYRNFVRDNSDYFAPNSDEKVENWEQWLENTDKSTYLSGPFVCKIEESFLKDRLIVPQVNQSPNAQSVGLLAWRKSQLNQYNDLWQLLPRYSRPAAAEEKRLNK